MGVILSIVFCLSTECQKIHPIPEALSSLTECQMVGEIEAAKWLEDHPLYRVDRIRCSFGKEPKEI